ncbi:MAG TPA: protein kinase [Solirubrobacteraceae bacterium]|nr:protein kinase [Solirubrobacteraceae bacterium]
MSTLRAPDLSGIALDGRYELHALIGEGTFGRVYRGRDRRLARNVAVKVIKPWWAEDPEWVRSFEREVQLLASVNDPGIVQIFDVGSAPEGLYYVSELVDGVSLSKRLKAGPLGPVEACEVAEQLAQALAAAHAQRVVHRDIKPANVLISSDSRVKVGDFGIARLFEENADGSATIVGTPTYMAPEQAHGRLGSPATDVYCAGIVLYEMLAGHPPFEAKTTVELALRHVQDPPPPLPDHTPEPLIQIVNRALQKEPAERYRDGKALARALSKAREELPDEDLPAQRPGVRTGAVGLLEREVGTSTTAPIVRTRRDRTSAPKSTAATPKGPAATPKGPTGTRIGNPVSSRRNVNPAERRQRVLIFVCVLAVVGGMITAALAIAPKHVTVPSLRGLSSGRVTATAHRLHLRLTVRHRHSTAAAGTAIAQDPAAGSRVKEGATLTVTLSDGPPPVPVPGVVGYSSADAQSTLKQAKLHPSITMVPALGGAPGDVIAQSPDAGKHVAPGSTVTVSVGEPRRLRALTTLQGSDDGRSVPFRIRGARWEIVYSMGYQDTCTFLLFCSGPSATMTNVTSGATVDQFDLSEGDNKTRIFDAGPGTYQITVSAGDDAAQWSIKVDDYY